MKVTKDKTQSPATARKRMQIFRFANGEGIDDSIMPFFGMDEATAAGMGKIMQATPKGVEGETIKMLFREPGENGMSLAYAWFRSGYVLPRHSHDADCLYYIIAGSLTMGTQTLSKGDGVFIPKDMTYAYEIGPEGLEVLEFRNVSHFHIHFNGNDEAYWDKQARARADRGPAWVSEAPPSECALGRQSAT